MELERHIEILLLDNDCVIVPGLGGFIAYHTDARYDAASASFIPPTRVAGFNPKLSMNDNLLAQSYVETYDISYPEAVKRISAEADELRTILERNGRYEITGVGTLSVNEKGGYDFMPFEAGLLTPELYGLGCFEAAGLSQNDSKVTTSEDNCKSDTDSSKFIRIKVSTVRYIAAAAVALFAFFLLSSPLGNNSKNMASIASLQNSVFYKMMPLDFTSENSNPGTPASVIKESEKETSVKDDVITSDTLTTAGPSAKEVKEEKTSENETASNAEEYYSIVLASALSKNNAENFVEKLSAEGCRDIHAISSTSGMKVVCGRFSSEEDARASLEDMKDNKSFKDAWIYKVRADR